MSRLPKKYSTVPLKLLSFHFYATNAILIGFLPIYLQYKGLSGVRVGWVLAAGPLASILSQPFWGYMSDKHKTVQKILVICLVGFLISSILFFQMDNFYYILSASLLLFFFSTPIGALTDSLSQKVAQEIGISFGSIRVWGSIGFALSSLIVGAILNKLGIGSTSFILLPLILFTGYLILKLPDAKYDSNSKVSLKDLKLIIYNRSLMIFLLLSMFLTITQRMNDNFIGLYILELGGTESLVGLAWFMALLGEGIVFGLSFYWYGKLKLHFLQYIMFAAAMYIVRWFSYAYVTKIVYIIFLQLLNGLTFAVFYLAAFAYISHLLPKKLHSTGHLFFITILFGVSGFFSAISGGIIMDTVGGRTLYILLGICATLGFIMISLYYMKSIRVRTNT